MAFFSEVEEWWQDTARERQKYGKTEFALGTVTENYNKELPGRVCVQIPVRDENANIYPWARVLMPSGSGKSGHFFIPEVGDMVMVVFLDGNVEQPYVLGSVYRENAAFLSQMADEKNQKKGIVTRFGTGMKITDSQEEDSGTKDQLLLETAGSERQLLLDNEAKTIVLRDKEGKDQIKINTEKESIEITAQKKLKVKVGDSIEISLNGENGQMTVQCSSLHVKTENNLKLDSKGSASFTSSNSLSLEGSGKAKLASQGQTVLEGSLIKLG